MTLELSRREAVALVALALTGATAFDTRSPLTSGILSRFSSRFGVDVGDDDIVAVISKLRSLMSGDSEDVVVVDDGE